MAKTITKVDATICEVLAARLKQPVTWLGLLTIIGSCLTDPTVLHFLSNFFLAIEAGRGWAGAAGVAIGSVLLFWQQQHPITPIAQGGDTGELVRNAGLVMMGANVLGGLLKRKPKARDDENGA